MAFTLAMTSSKCAETDSAHKTQVTNDSFDVGAFSGQVNQAYAFFDASTLPAGALVTGASFALRQFNGSYYSASVTMRAEVCSNYIANTSVTWNNAPTGSGIYGSLTFSGDTDATRTWTIPTASNLADYVFSNYIIVKVYINGAEAGDNNAKGFRPSTYGTTGYRPKLTLTYELAQVKIWTGAAFEYKPLKYYDGDSWEYPVIKYYNGATFTTL